MVLIDSRSPDLERNSSAFSTDRMVMPEPWRTSSTPTWLSRKTARRTVSGETLYWLASAERPRIFCPGWYFPLTTLAAISTAICL